MSAEPFLTHGVDIESHFLNPDYLAELNGKSASKMIDLIKDATSATREVSIEKYVNGRTNIEKKNGTFGKLNVGQLATEAPKKIDGNPERYRHSKMVVKEVRRKFQEVYSTSIQLIKSSDKLKVAELAAIAKKL
jgi:hypothetical protein